MTRDELIAAMVQAINRTPACTATGEADAALTAVEAAGWSPDVAGHLSDMVERQAAEIAALREALEEIAEDEYSGGRSAKIARAALKEPRA